MTEPDKTLVDANAKTRKYANSFFFIQFPLSKVCGNYYTILDNIRKEIFYVMGYFEKQFLLRLLRNLIKPDSCEPGSMK